MKWITRVFEIIHNHFTFWQIVIWYLQVIYNWCTELKYSIVIYFHCICHLFFFKFKKKFILNVQMPMACSLHNRVEGEVI